MSRGRFLGFAVLLAIPFGPATGRAAAPSQIVFSADRQPSVSGEIYLLHANGRAVDLSRSPAQDVAPTVSWDGRKVAFVSNRTPKGAVYEVGIDGHGLVRVSPRTRLGWDSSTALAWQPHGPRLALDANDGLWIVRHGGKPVKVSGKGDELAAKPWSPDGRVLLVEEEYGAELTAITPQGRKLWNVVDGSAPTWSSQGLVALKIQDGGSASVVAVYDQRGHALFRIPFASGFPSPSWSPDGSRLAVLSGEKLQLWTATGALIERKRIAQLSQIAWAGTHRLLVVHNYRSPWLRPRSADGRYAAITQRSGNGFRLRVEPAAGGAAKTYADVPGCWDDGVWWPAVDYLQFAGGSRSLVYMKACYEPFANLYSVAPDGSGVHKIALPPYDTQPAVSPDGGQVAYVWAQFTGLSCKGCASEIRVANADGADAHLLTNPTQDCTFDTSPTWSPDGRSILFAEGSCSDPAELYTVSASGGTPHDLGIVGSNPAWGPTRIAYEGAHGLWTANPDGSDPAEVASVGADPAWSADGRLAYRLGSTSRTVVVGSMQVRLPFASVTSLTWSPDDTHFVVTARKTRTAVPDLYSIRTDGTDPIQLTKNYDALSAGW